MTLIMGSGPQKKKKKISLIYLFKFGENSTDSKCIVHQESDLM